MFHLRPVTVYLILQGFLSFGLSTVFTVAAVYRVQTVGLDPLQLVLVGTLLEAACFILEVPTGVVADVVSRRLSVIIGVALLGAGALIEGAVAAFGATLLAQVVCAFGYTFTSGATEAWIADEVGADKAEPVYLRGAQASQLGALLGIGASVLLASARLNLPLLVGGGLVLGLAGLLTATMPEHGFQPLPRGERAAWRSMGATFSAGLRSVRGRPILIILLLISAVAGMASEGFDRLWQNHMLANFSFPALGGFDPVVWFGIISAGGAVLGIVAVGLISRFLRDRPGQAARTLFGLYAMLSLSVIAFAVAGQFGLAVAAFWAASIARRSSQPLYAAWLNRNIDSRVRATVISMSSQSDALGQVAGGPLIGLIASAVSLRAALVVSGLCLAPLLLLFRRSKAAGEAGSIAEGGAA